MTTLTHTRTRKPRSLDIEPVPDEAPARFRSRKARSPDPAAPPLKLTAVRLTSDVYDAVVRLAYRRRRSLSAQLELLIERGMRDVGELPPDPASDDDRD